VKIFFLIRSLDCGGAERQLTVLSKGLCELGHDVVVAAFYAGGSLEKELRDTKVRILPLNKSGRWDVFRFIAQLIRAVRAERPDVLHGYLEDPNLLTVVLKPLVRNLKIVWGIRSSARDSNQQSRLERLSSQLNCWLSGFADAIIANSRAGGDASVARGYPSGKTVVIPNGVDTEQFKPNQEARRRIRREWGVAEQARVVGVVGRLSPIKDHPNFLRAAALLAQKRNDVRFVCVGDGPADYRRTLQVLAEDLGLKESLIWNTAREDLSAVYNALDILVNSSSCEGLSNVIGEAMACGVPCVVTNVGDSAWVVGDTGEVVPPNDPVALKKAIERLLDQNAYGPAQIRQGIVNRLSVSNLVASTERTLNALLTHSMNEAAVKSIPATVGDSIATVTKMGDSSQ
jgi:glycosyltransferase involved in cell wall biosynthesis